MNNIIVNTIVWRSKNRSYYRSHSRLDFTPDYNADYRRYIKLEYNPDNSSDYVKECCL